MGKLATPYPIKTIGRICPNGSRFKKEYSTDKQFSSERRFKNPFRIILYKPLYEESFYGTARVDKYTMETFTQNKGNKYEKVPKWFDTPYLLHVFTPPVAETALICSVPGVVRRRRRFYLLYETEL